MRAVKVLRVEDVMTPSVVVVQEDAPFKELVRLMHEHRVSGVPVLDAEKRLVGIVTEADLLRAEDEWGQHRKRSFLAWFLHPGGFERIAARSEGIRAADLMSRDVVTVTPDVPVREAIRILLDAGVKRLPVVNDERRVVGIVSRADLLLPFLRPDDEIAKEIRDDVIFGVMWIDPSSIEVEVNDGVVSLTGRVERRSVKEIMVELVHRVDGVVGVEDQRLTYRRDDREIRPEAPQSERPWAENWIPRR